MSTNRTSSNEDMSRERNVQSDENVIHIRLLNQQLTIPALQRANFFDYFRYPNQSSFEFANSLTPHTIDADQRLPHLRIRTYSDYALSSGYVSDSDSTEIQDIERIETRQTMDRVNSATGEHRVIIVHNLPVHCTPADLLQLLRGRGFVVDDVLFAGNGHFYVILDSQNAAVEAQNTIRSTRIEYDGYLLRAKFRYLSRLSRFTSI